MSKRYLLWPPHLILVLAFGLGAALCGRAQPAGGLGGGAGGARTGAAGGTTGANTAGRQYPNNGTIGDAYFSFDPETH